MKTLQEESAAESSPVEQQDVTEQGTSPASTDTSIKTAEESTTNGVQQETNEGKD